MSAPEPQLVLQIGQQMMQVADWEDLHDSVYWDENDEQWHQNGPWSNFPAMLAEKLNRMHYEPVVKLGLTTEGEAIR